MDMRVILHVDMDAFFASIEQRDHSELRGKPVIVGGRAEERGVVATASYEARAFGVHSAMAMAEAQKRCKDCIIVGSDIEKYQRESKKIITLMGKYTPMIEVVSVDEAFLDVTHSQLLFGTGLDIGKQIREDIFKETGLTASVGVSYNKFLAKLASDMNKPDGLIFIGPDDLEKKVWGLPIRRMMGVGRQMEVKMKGLNIHTIGDLAQRNPKDLSKYFGKNAQAMWERANGKDERPVKTRESIKSIGHEETFAQDISDYETIETHMMDLTDRVCRRLRKHGVEGRKVSIKWRYPNFETYTRVTTMKEPSQDFEIIWQVVLGLFQKYYSKEPVRLVGVTVSDLSELSQAYHQQDLFSEIEKSRDIDKLLDDINQKTGKKCVARARLYPLERKNDRE